MLKLSRLLKSIFRSVILLLLVLEVILLVSILLIYRNNTEQIKSGLQTNIKSGIINYRDLFVTYLANKYYMLSEDLIFLLRTFESILDNPNYPVNNNLTDIELNCMVNGNKILQIWNTSAYNPAWYDSPQENLASRLVGMWFTTRDQLTYDKLAPQDKYYIQAMCSISRIYKDILSKHLNWKDYFGVTNDQYYFAFSNSFFALFPSYNKPYMTSKAGEWTDTTRKLTCNTTRDINSYDPICRMYYQDVINANERLVISSPYRFASTGLYGSSLCTKGKRFDYKKMLPEVVICIDYNFKDMDLFGLDLQNFLENKRIFIVQQVDNIIKVIFSTSVNSINFISYGAFLGLNKLEGNDFFEVLNYNTFKQMNNSLDYSKIDLKKLKSLNYTELRSKGIESLPASYSRDEINYVEFCFDYLTIYEKYKQNISRNISYVINTINATDIETNRLYMLELPSSYEYNNSTGNININNNVMQIFTLPIPLSFDYIDDYNIVKNNNTKFFFLFVQNPDSIQIIDSFYMNILFSMIFSFISVCFLNLIIWVVIGSCYYFYFKAVLAPLKKINNEFKELVFIKEKNFEIKNKKLKRQDLMIDKPPRFINTIENKILMFLQKTTVDLTEYDEIYDALITLKVLKAIREYKLISPKNIKLNKTKKREEHMQGIMKALLFLMLKLSDNIVEDIHFDSRLIADLIYHNFMYKIVTDEKDRNVTFFYQYFINLIDKTIENSEKNYKKFKKLEVIKSIEEKRLQINNDYVDIENFINKHSGLKNLKDVYQNLKEDIQYRYCVYKLKSMEKFKVKEIEDKNVCYTSSDEEEERNTELKVDNSDENKGFSATRRDFRSIKLRHKTNFAEEEELIFNDEDQEKLNNNEFIKSLISDFLKYFSITNTNEISLNTLKHISVHIILANLFFEVNKEGECLKQCTLAMEKIKLMQEKVSTLGNLTKFSFLSICVLFYEKMFYIFSKLSQKFDQKKTEFFIYLKMLDLGPIFDSRIRITVFQNIMDFMKKNELKKQRFSKNILGKISKDEKEINCKIIRHKIRAMMNMTMKVPKFITYLIDVNCPFLKEKDFLYLFEKIQKLANNTTVNFVLFNESLIFPPKDGENECSFMFNLDYQEYSNKTSVLDKAILDSLDKYQYNEFPKNNNYLFALTTIDSQFDFSMENLSKITLQIFKEKYSLILIIFWDDKIYESSDLRKKLHQLRKWIENNTNGIMIVVKNYSVIKQLLTCIHPLRFKEFDPIVLKNMVTSIDLNLHLECMLMKKTSNSQNKNGLVSKDLTTFQVKDEKGTQSNKVDETVNEEQIYFIN